MTDPVLSRLASVDWMGKSEPTISSQLIVPVLHLLGYGEHTLHRIVEQQSYKLRDPTMMKGSRRVKLDYEPRVYEEGLWVMEAKRTDENVTSKTLGQVRDYAIHPEVRAALMVTVDAAGFRVFDPWDEHWDEPLLVVPINDVATHIEDLRAILGVDRVADVIRDRHLDHLRRALSASLEFGVVEDTERDFRALLTEARANISTRRHEIHQKALADRTALHERVVRNSGVWGVAQHQNSPWVGSLSAVDDFVIAVLHQPERQRETQIRSVWPAIEAVFKDRCPRGAFLLRPLWWLHVVVLGGCVRLRRQPGCEPVASEFSQQAIRSVLLAFPDDPIAAAFWQLQRILIPLTTRIVGLAPLEELSAAARRKLSSEQRIRYAMEPSWFFDHAVRRSLLEYIARIEPWTVEQLEAETEKLDETLRTASIPSREWPGPFGDPWLQSWNEIDPLLMSGLAVLQHESAGDDLLAEPDIGKVIVDAAGSEHELLRRPALPLARRLGLITENPSDGG